MKINCINTFDIKKFKDGIEKFKVLTGQTPYAFMSDSTGRLLKRECEMTFLIINNSNPIRNSLSDLLSKGEIARCEGVKIYPDNDLPLGVVELR